VTGDDRIVAALATHGRTGSSGIGQAIEVAFGNLGLLVGTLVVLAALMTVGGTTAAFAAAVAARRRTLGVYRATGATPARVARLVLADALRIGIVAAIIAVALASVALAGLGAADLLVVFGVRIGFPTPAVLLVCAAGAVLLTLVAAGLALIATLRAPVGELLSGTGVEPPSAGQGGAGGPKRASTGTARSAAAPGDAND
jgi:ABC-type antimicrobial peptide transport system permease subunit